MNDDLQAKIEEAVKTRATRGNEGRWTLSAPWER
jgi:hypothetical protein